jgi:colanic acid/amylovoran biosynthesis glycosyltransferase
MSDREPAVVPQTIKDDHGPSKPPAAAKAQFKALLISGVYYPPQVGGISRFMEKVALALGPDRVCCLTGVAATDDESRGGPKVYRYPSIVGSSRLLKMVGWASAVLKILMRERPGIVILGAVDDSHFGLWLYRWFNIPFIVFAYGNEILETCSEDYQRQQLALKKAKRILASSTYTAGIVQEAGGNPDRIEILYPGCDTDFFRPVVANEDLRRRLLGSRHQSSVILTVGNLVSRKGQDMVIRAMPRLLSRVPDAVYMIAGSGPYRDELEKLAADLGVLEHIVFVGRIPDQDLPDLYALCDVFVMVSRARLEENDVEGFGMVLLEANACGKPVVGGRSGGVPDALADGITGLLVDPLNPDEIADAVARLLTDRELATKFGEQGRQRVLRDFQWQGVGERVQRVLESVLGEGRDEKSEPLKPSLSGNIAATSANSRRDERTLCIVLPYVPALTETFITNHIENLPAKIVTVDGWRPSVNGRTVLSLPQRVVHKARRTVSGAGLEAETTEAYVKVFRRNRVGAVLAEYGTTGVLTVEACRRLNIPLIVYFFGYDASVRSVLEEHAESYPRMFRQAAAIIACSRSIKRRLVSLGASADKVHCIPCGVDCASFAGGDPAAAAPIFLGVGRFVEKKAPQLTIKAFAEVYAVCPEARLRMVGDGPLLNECRELVQALGIADRVELPGALPHDTLRMEMRKARCFVQHSVEAPSGDCEGLPVGILEAGASGLPVISTRHAGIPDVVIEGRTGFLIEEGDVAGMAAHMLRLARDPALAGELGRAGQVRVNDHFSVADSNAALWKVIESCLDGVPIIAVDPML